MKKQICKLYKQGMSAYDIMDILKISSRRYVYRIIKQAGILRPKGEDKHPNVNKTYFSKIDTPEKAYWLGFLFADGCVNNNDHGVSIGIHPKDIELLIRLKKVLTLDNKLEYTNQPVVSLRFGNIQIHDDLISHGCVPRKSLILKPPIDLP